MTETAETYAALRDCSFLVSDEEGIVVLQIVKALHAAGVADVWQERDGDGAVGTALTRRPDVILIGTTFSTGLDGWEACKRILAADPHYNPCIIVVTGQDASTVARMRAVVPVAGCIAKPIMGAELLAEVAKCLELHRARPGQ
jgi:CheY-like chemotaxis protein